MSTHSKALTPIILCVLLFARGSFAQDVHATLTVEASSPQVLHVKGEFTASTARNLSIIRDFAGISGLAERVSGVKLENSSRQTVAFKQPIPGEIVADAEFTSWSYSVDLAPRAGQRAAGHTSWIGPETGLIFLRDVLPLVRDRSPGRVSLELPAGWTSSKGSATFEVSDVDRAVILIGKELRSGENASVKIVTTGKWRFDDKRLGDFSEEILRSYSERIGKLPLSDVEVVYIPFPRPMPAGTWEADSRGKTVVILSSDMPFETQSVQRLHEQLRHELFHLWFPNGVSLKGNYDWFYEGFALYESLKLGVELNRLRFDDFLDTLGRAITIDSMRIVDRSLIDVSKTRTLEDTTVYARGMLAAFLTDLELLRTSKGNEDVTSLIRNIYKRYQASRQAVDGNTAVLDEIKFPSVGRFIRGEEQPNWPDTLRPAGIEITAQPGLTSLRVSQRLSSGQKRLLDKLGYNNWRRSTVAPR